MTSKTESPKAATSRRAKCGPMPRRRPEARYFSMPSIEVGAAARSQTARNCRPCVRSFSQVPPA